MVTRHVDPASYRVSQATKDGGTIDLNKEEIYAPGGHRVTEAETEEFTASRGGRPSLSGTAAPSPVLGVRLPPALRKQVDAAAAESGVPAAQVVRQALTAWLGANEHPPASTRR